MKLNPGILPVTASGSDEGILDRHIDISNQRNIAKILEQLESAVDISSMTPIVIDAVREMIPERINPVVSDALQEIINQEGCLNIASIADNMMYSQNHINREFKKNMGFSLKQYSEIIRLQNAITYLENAKTDMVYEQLGYYDQAHFIKDFKKFTLLTPQNYMNRSLQGIFV